MIPGLSQLQLNTSKSLHSSQLTFSSHLLHPSSLPSNLSTHHHLSSIIIVSIATPPGVRSLTIINRERLRRLSTLHVSRQSAPSRTRTPPQQLFLHRYTFTRLYSIALDLSASSGCLCCDLVCQHTYPPLWASVRSLGGASCPPFSVAVHIGRATSSRPFRPQLASSHA